MTQKRCIMYNIIVQSFPAFNQAKPKEEKNIIL